LIHCLLSLRGCSDAVKMLDALSGLVALEPELRNLSEITGSPLAEALAAATVEDLADVVAAGLAISPETARVFLDAAGGMQRALTALEANTPWCRNVRVGAPTPELLDGRDVPDLRADSLVARVEYRYVADTLQCGVHEATVALATMIFRLLPDVELVRAVAVDARNQPHGFRGFEIASTWLKRDAVPGSEKISWNVARSQLVTSLLAAESRTAGLTTEMKLLEQSVSCLTSFAEAWLKDGQQGTRVLQAINARRIPLIQALNEVASWDPPDDSASPGKGVSLTPILHDCVENVIRRLSTDGENLRAVSAFINDLVHRRLSDAAEPSRWRYLGFTEAPPELARLRSTLQDLGWIAAEIGFGGTTKARIEDAVRTVRRPLALRRAATMSRSCADTRFDESCRRLQTALDDARWTLTLIRREAIKPDVAWPPVDLVLLVHVDRLDRWGAIHERLLQARSVLPAGVKLSALPVRESTILKHFCVSVGDRALFPAPDAVEGWTFPDCAALSTGAYSSFTAVVNAAFALSSLAALPEGPRDGVESAAVSKLVEELNRSRQMFLEIMEANRESLLLLQAGKFALELTIQAIDELMGVAASAGELARWVLQMLDGADAQSSRTQTYRGCIFLLTEWDVSPTKASEWFAEHSNG
jgi:hypothetical protein